MKRFTNDLPAWLKLLFDFIIMFAVFTVTLILGAAVIKLVAGYSFNQIIFAAKSDDITLLRYSVALQSLGFFLIPALVIAFIYDRPKNYLLVNKFPPNSIIITAVIVIFSLQPVISFSAKLNQNIHLPDVLSSLELWMKQAEEATEQLTEKLLSGTTVKDLIISLIVIALIPAIGEEFFFRGILQRHFIELSKSATTGIILTAAVFSAFHFQFLTFLPRFILGLLLGSVVFWTKSLWPSILMHFTNNSLGVLMYFYANKKGISPDSLEQQTNGKIFVFYLLIGIILSLLLIYGIYRKSKNQQTL